MRLKICSQLLDYKHLYLNTRYTLTPVEQKVTLARQIHYLTSTHNYFINRRIILWELCCWSRKVILEAAIHTCFSIKQALLKILTNSQEKKNLNTSSGIGTARASIQVNRKDILKIENFADFYSILFVYLNIRLINNISSEASTWSVL